MSPVLSESGDETEDGKQKQGLSPVLSSDLAKSEGETEDGKTPPKNPNKKPADIAFAGFLHF